MNQVITLMYHDVIDDPAQHQASGFPWPDAAIYKLARGEFTAHLEAIGKAIGTRPVSTSERQQEWREVAPLLFTFDDGGVSALDPIAPMLEERGWRGHFFIATDYIDTPGFLSPGQLRDLRRRGHVIGSHSRSHPLRMGACSREQLRGEWQDSVAALSDILGDAVTIASVPGGQYSRAVAETAAEAGIGVLFNSEPESRARAVNSTTILGRYEIRKGMPAQAVMALARGDFWPAFRQKALWNAKKAVKALGGNTYLRVRAFLLSR
jgi:peptidoglycan/xylan/chitin deacetylase (PgdA/CDA1 family)